MYLFVNFKTYEEATGENAVSLSKTMDSLSPKGVKLICVPQAIDLKQVSNAVSILVFAQHADPISYGSNTGSILPEAVKGAGAVGVVINHAENKRDNEFVSKTVARCRQAGLKVMVCAENVERAKEVAAFSPDFIAIEPPELIGGDISVSTANPSLISDSVAAIKAINKKIIVITGAGIKTSADVSKAIELGSFGVFVASGIVKAGDKKAALKELLLGFP